MRAPLLTLLATLLAALPLRAADRSAPLRSVEEARALSYKEAATGRTVQLEGVITYLRYASGSQFNFNLNDSTGGVMVYPRQHADLQTAQRVKIKGRTMMSLHGLRIQADTIEAGSIEALPTPEPLAFEALREQRSQGRYVEVEATLRSARMESPEIQPRRLALDFGSAKDRITAWVLHFEPGPEAYTPGARLRIKGVPLHWTNDRGQMQSVSLIVNAMSDVERMAKPAPPLPQSLEEVLVWNAAARPESPITTTGTVTFVRPGEWMVIQEGRHSLRVRPIHPEALGMPVRNSPTAPPAPGDLVEVTGYPAMGGYTVELEDSTLTPLGSSEPTPPREYANAAEVLRSRGLVDRDSQLLRLPGALLNIRDRDGDTVLELQSGKATFTALLPQEQPLPPGARPGAELSVTGICSLYLSEERRRLGKTPDQFSLQLAHAGQLTVLRPAPWWNKRRLFLAASTALFAALVCGLWAILAGRKNARLRAEIAKRELAEQRLTFDRKRMAGDLHDTLEQTLLAAGLQLAAASRTLEQRPEAAAAKLTLANQLLARGRKEVRDAVWDLHVGENQAQSLGLLLKTACAEADAQGATSVSFHGTADPPHLPAPITSQVLRIVQEALTNALKHASASRIEVRFEYTPEALVLSIADDGCGLDPTRVPGPEAGHFGLSSIRERVQRLGGSFEIKTSPDGGTLIAAQIPLPPR